MLLRLGLFAGAMFVMAATVPQMATSYLGWRDAQVPGAADSKALSATQAPKAALMSGRRAVLPAGASGHFTGTFTINGRKQDGLIDTGASTVAMNVTAARRMGLSPNGLTFDIPVDTANGRVAAARIVLDRMSIGPVTVDDVDALILPDASLSSMLVGMSFLGKLSSYKVENNQLQLIR